MNLDFVSNNQELVQLIQNFKLLMNSGTITSLEATKEFLHGIEKIIISKRDSISS